MKTWIMENKALAIFLGLVILAGLIFLGRYLYNKYGAKENSGSTPKVDPYVAGNVNGPGAAATGRIGSVSSTGSAMPSGGRVSSGGKTH